MTGSGWLVGHERARSDFAGSLADLRAGVGGLVLVSGEPGIGKSALLAWLVGTAGPVDGGVRVLRGFCWEDAGAPSYWPWVQVLRAAGLSREELGEAGRLLDPVPAAPARRAVDVVDAAGRAAGGDRFGLFDAVATAIARLARDEPVLVVLDDLHWADEASLDLLSFVARACAGDPLLVVGAYRDTEAPPRLRELASGARDVPLRGLGLADAASLVGAMPGGPLAEGVVERVWERSGGNPLFVRELARLVRSTGPGQVPARLPAGVVETVRRRLARLSTDCVRLLDVAAVAGREIDPSLLVAAGAAPDASDGPGPAGRGPRERRGRPSTTSPGSPTTSTARPSSRRSPHGSPKALHRDLATALLVDGAPGGAAGSPATCSGPAGPPGTTPSAWSLRAAREATERLAHDEACRHLETRLVAGRSERATPRGGAARAGRFSGRGPAGTRRRASRCGRRSGSVAGSVTRSRVARGALVLQGLGQRSAEQYAEVLDLLGGAADLLAGHDDVALRARVAAASAVTLRHSRFGPGDPALVGVATQRGGARRDLRRPRRAGGGPAGAARRGLGAGHCRRAPGRRRCDGVGGRAGRGRRAGRAGPPAARDRAARAR